MKPVDSDPYADPDLYAYATEDDEEDAIGSDDYYGYDDGGDEGEEYYGG